MRNREFRLIGTLSVEASIELWWNDSSKVQVCLLDLGDEIVLKASKPYYLTSVSSEGRLWARDLGALQSYLEAHFPELHLSFSYYRDISRTLAKDHLARTATATAAAPLVTPQDLAAIQERLAEVRGRHQTTTRLGELEDGSSSLLTSHLRKRATEGKREIRNLRQAVQETKVRAELFEHLQEEYLRKGSAASYVFSACSHLQLASSCEEFEGALSSVHDELMDLHRHQIHQKLSSGKLNVQIKEASDPAAIWIDTWFCAGLTPRQLEALPHESAHFRKELSAHQMVSPDQDVVVQGRVREDKKVVAARVVQSIVSRLDGSESQGARLNDISADQTPVELGLVMRGQSATTERARFPLEQFGNAYVSGSTGSGKTYLARVLLEEVASSDVNILVLDPRNQAAGLVVPEDREEILSLYGSFGLKSDQARGYEFSYYAPNEASSDPLPGDRGALGKGRCIVSFRGLDDAQRCNLFAEVLDAVFDAHASEESPGVRLVLFIDEAQRFTKKQVDESARAAAARAERALDRTLREGRKYGCCTIIISQTIKDFGYGSASIRQNTNTKVFLHNSDREIEYAATLIGDGRQIAQLTPATAIIHNAVWGAVKVKVRPPFSKVWEFSATDTARLLSSPIEPKPVSEAAQDLLSAVADHFEATKMGLNVSQAADLLGLTSRRRLHDLVRELESAGLVRTRKLQARGQPRVIEPILSKGLDKTPDVTRTQGGTTQ